MKRNLKPYGDRVVVERVELPGNIIIPEGVLETQRDHREGIVLSIGSGKVYKRAGRRVPWHDDIKPGDRAVFSKWAGSPMRIDGRDVIVMQAKDVLAVVELA